jgi:hypothetical protein
MDDLAQIWALPIAMGYLPPHYRGHSAGGRLIALSKHLKPGVRPICISDAIRRLVAKGLFACYEESFTSVFQNSHPRVLQFGANLKNGATHIFHLIAGVLHHASECTDDDPIAIVSLDVAFNTLSRAHLTKVFLQHQQANSCFLSPEARPDSDAIDLGFWVMTFYGNTFRATMAAKVCSHFIITGPLGIS